MKKETAERIQSIFNWVRFIILVLFLAFVFVGLSKAQTTHDSGMWISAGTEKKLNDRWNLGASIELRTKDDTKSIDRWQLVLNGAYKVSEHLKLGGCYEFQLRNRTIDNATEFVPRHRLMFDVTPGTKVFDWLKLSLRERYQYTYTMQKSHVAATHEHHLRNRLKAEIDNSSMKGWSPYVSVEMFNNLSKQFQIDEMRMAIGTTYSISARHTINFGYLLDLKRSAGGLDKALHVLTLGYVYKM
jgi:hypothetical protein